MRRHSNSPISQGNLKPQTISIFWLIVVVLLFSSLFGHTGQVYIGLTKPQQNAATIICYQWAISDIVNYYDEIYLKFLPNCVV